MPSGPLVLVTATSDLASPTSDAAPACDMHSARVWLDQAYVDSLIDGGVIPVVAPPMAESLAVTALDQMAGLVLIGGEDLDPSLFGEEPHPATGAPNRKRDAYEIALVRAARRRRLPTLAICRGAQVVNVASGGTLNQDISPDHPRGRERVHDVDLASESRLCAIAGAVRLRVNGYHHQAIGRLAPSLRAVGLSTDGIVEAIEAVDPDWWMVGVQWHAEHLTTTEEDWDRRLFSAFAEAARGRRASVKGELGHAEMRRIERSEQPVAQLVE